MVKQNSQVENYSNLMGVQKSIMKTFPYTFKLLYGTIELPNNVQSDSECCVIH